MHIFFLIAAVEVDLLLPHLHPHQLLILSPGLLQFLSKFLLILAAKAHLLVWSGSEGYSRYRGLTFIILMQRFRDYRQRVVLEREEHPRTGWNNWEAEMWRKEEEPMENFDCFEDNMQDYLFRNYGASTEKDLSTMSSISSSEDEHSQHRETSASNFMLDCDYRSLFYQCENEWPCDQLQGCAVDCLSSDGNMLQLSATDRLAKLTPSLLVFPTKQAEEEAMEMMFQRQYRDLFQSSLSEIELKDSLSNNNTLKVIAEEIEDTASAGSERFKRIMDVLNQSDRDGHLQKDKNSAKEELKIVVKGRTIIVLTKTDKPLLEKSKKNKQKGRSTMRNS